MSVPDAKLRFFGLVKTAEELEQELEYEAISDSLDVPVTMLKKWKKEHDKLKTRETVVDLLDVDKMMIDEVASHVKEKVSAEVSGPQMEIKNGKIVVVPDKVEPAVSAKLDTFKDSVTGLQMLQEEVQGTAGTLVSRIAVLAEDSELTARDLASLTTALTGIQQAFFNRATTNIQVNTVNGGGESLLSSFRENLKS